MKIGEAIASIEFTEAERSRLAAALQDPNSLPRTVLNAKAEGIRDHGFWSGAQNRFGVTGFRPGNATAKKMVLRRALEDAKRPGGGHKIWTLYRRCVTEFVNQDLPELQELLLVEELAGDGQLTEQIMRSIAPRMPVYGVTADQVLKVYELWGFDRSEQVESILSGSGVDINIVKELLTRNERSVWQRIEQRIARDGREAAVALEAQLATGLTEWRMELDQVKEHVVSLIDAAKKDLLKESVSGKERQAETKERVRTPPRVDASVVQRLSGQLDELRSTINRHDRLLAAVGGSIPTGRPTTKKNSNETWEQILSRCQRRCADEGFVGVSLAASRVLAEMLRRTRVVICDRATLPVTALTAIYDAEVTQIAASPLWTSDRDWQQGLKFVSTPASRARVLVVLDFDVGVQEAYLLPALRSWMASANTDDAAWVVLVPSDSRLREVCPRVLECGVTLGHDNDFLAELARSGERVDRAENVSWKNSVSNSALHHAITRNSEFEAQIAKLGENCGADLPVELIARFVNISEGLSQVVQRGDSVRVTSGITLLPWIRLVRSDAVARIFEETLRTVVGDVYQ